jgi:hypothetical protein
MNLNVFRNDFFHWDSSTYVRPFAMGNLWKSIKVMVTQGLMWPPEVAEVIVRARMIPKAYAIPTAKRAISH